MIKDRLDAVYYRWNRPEYINPDPLKFLYDYKDTKDREVVGLLCSCLAYGRVQMIMSIIEQVLEPLGPHPSDWICRTSEKDIQKLFKGFVYRFARENHLTTLILGIRQILFRFGSIEACFYRGMDFSFHENVMISGLIYLHSCLDPEKKAGHLLADPLKKSACKRSFLFLRWMIRKDLVDPGGWNSDLAKDLIIPLDTHMYSIGRLLGFTCRKSQDMKTALEITRGFQEIVPDDPVKYDFCLTRFGLRKELQIERLEKELCLTAVSETGK